MPRRQVKLFVLCLVLGGIAAQAFGQDTVKLQYKFTPGELLRYKMTMNANVNMQMSMPEATGSQMPSMPFRVVGVVRQRTKRILPNGDAEIAVAFESMRITMGEKTETMPGDKIPVTTMTISKDGTVKNVSGMEKMGGQFAGMPFVSPSSLGQYNGLPDKDLTIGESWSQTVPFPTGGGNLQVTGTLVSTNTKLGKYNVATFRQSAGGDIDLGAFMPTGMQSSGGSSSGNATFIGDATIYFAPEEGRVIRTEGKAAAQVAMNFSGGPEGQSGAMAMTMDMKFDLFLLSQGK